MIKNCPFCGAPAHISVIEMGDKMEVYYRVICEGHKNHSLDYLAETDIDAANEWNERPQVIVHDVEQYYKGEENEN